MKVFKSKVKRQKANELSPADRWLVFGILLFLFTIYHSPLTVIAQTGGPYDLSHNVIAGGGGSNSTGGTFSISGTVGQHAAGVSSGGTPFDLHGGFWFQNLAPTSAAVAVTGRVTTADGRGIRGVRLTLSAPDGSRLRAITSNFGYYAFGGVPVGQTYVLEISSNRFTFTNPTRIFSLQDELTNMDFTALPL
ncbi:MAG: carboxypeptidase regulatory-like domain-containing protein [Acidobacteriota bacterium]|nr:MAG: carboxypeptidase regulatory-like domain-containing protein [Acidobacteriota bacterium]